MVGEGETVNQIGPNVRVRFLMYFTISTPSLPWNIEITWLDNSGHTGQFRFPLWV